MKELNVKQKEFVDEVLEGLNEEVAPWFKPWQAEALPYNFNTGKAYKGENQVYLMIVSMNRGYDDPRWITAAQCKQKRLLIKKGSKGVKLNRYSYYNPELKKEISIYDYYKLNSEEQENYKFCVKHFCVFNLSQIENAPAYEPVTREIKTDLELENIVNNIANNMNIKIGLSLDTACYLYETDEISIPNAKNFKSYEHYVATLLHELSHATGHKNRLDRNIKNAFGTIEYAKEELIAEIASTILCIEFNISNEALVNNSKAYINSWNQLLKEQPEALFEAIKAADQARNYILEKSNATIQKNINIELQNVEYIN